MLNFWDIVDVYLAENNREAHAALYFELLSEDETASDRKIFTHNADREIASASIIKLHIAAFLREEVLAGNKSLDEKISIDKSKEILGNGILKFLNDGHELTVKELAKLMLGISDSFASDILIDYLGMDAINDWLKTSGYENTRINKYFMTIEPDAEVNVTSVRDTAMILKYFYKLAHEEDQYAQEIIATLLEQEKHGGLTINLDYDAKIAHKTGVWENLEHNAGIFFMPKADYVLVMFTQGVQNQKAKNYMGQLSRDIYDYL